MLSDGLVEIVYLYDLRKIPNSTRLAVANLGGLQFNENGLDTSNPRNSDLPYAVPETGSSKVCRLKNPVY